MNLVHPISGEDYQTFFDSKGGKAAEDFIPFPTAFTKKERSIGRPNAGYTKPTMSRLCGAGYKAVFSNVE